MFWGSIEGSHEFGAAKRIGDMWFIQSDPNPHANHRACATPTGWYPWAIEMTEPKRSLCILDDQRTLKILGETEVIGKIYLVIIANSPIPRYQEMVGKAVSIVTEDQNVLTNGQILSIELHSDSANMYNIVIKN